MENTTTPEWLEYESKYNSEEVEAVRQFFNDNPNIALSDAQKLSFLKEIEDGDYEGKNWEGGSEYGDGHSFCAIYSIDWSDIEIGLDMTYSSWDSSYFNGDVWIVSYEEKIVNVPKLVKVSLNKPE